MKKNLNVNFVGRRNLFAYISLGILLTGILCTVIFGVEMDVSFKGGTLLKYSYTGEISNEALEDTLGAQIKENLVVDTTVSGDVQVISISTTQVLDPAEQNKVEDLLQKTYKDAKIERLSVNALEPTMGQLFFVKCLVAVALASVLLVAYIGFRFWKIGGISAGVFAVLALLNDLLVVFFTFVVFRIPLNDNFVAVMLTILGYSLNDTIVIYDRIRENRRRMGAATPIAEVANTSINQTFGRTMNTSVCTALALATVMVIALVVNMESIVSLVVPMMFGVLSGFYTSVCLCAPLWTKWVEYREKHAKPAKSKTAKKKA